MFNHDKALYIQRKANAVIASCTTPAQLRVATTYAYKSLAVIGKLLGEEAFKKCHEAFSDLINMKARQMKSRRAWFF